MDVPSDDMVARIAKLGARGKHSQNIERDLHSLGRTLGPTLKIPAMPVPTRIYDYRTTAVTWKQTHIIYPDDILLSLWEQDRELWKQLLVGDTDLAGFWERCGRSHWFQHHPCYHEENKSKLIPFSLYGGEIQCFRNTESGSVSVMAWSSDMAFDKPPLHRYYLIAVYAEQTSTDYTYNDIIRALLPRLQKLFSNDESYPWVREGWKFAFSSCQGDLKYLVEKLGFNNYRANRFCSRCPCSKTSPNVGLTLGDFRMDAEHTKTRFHHEDYLASSNPEDRFLASHRRIGLIHRPLLCIEPLPLSCGEPFFVYAWDRYVTQTHFFLKWPLIYGQPFNYREHVAISP